MMQIVQEKNRYHKYAFEFDFSYETLEFCRYLKTTYGWKNFGWLDKKWRFSSPVLAFKIIERYKDVKMPPEMLKDAEKEKLRLQADKILVDKANKIKKKKTSDFKVENLKMELYPYQTIGVEFFINNKGKAILADPMGLGKTVQALGYIVHEKLSKTLVVCPSSVKFTWESEVEKWTKLKSLVISRLSNITLSDFDEYDIFIINYDILKKFLKLLTTVRFDCIVFDEFHYIKNSKAQRTKLAKKIASKIPKCLLLSGTPMLSRPAELFTGLQLMDPVVWNDYYAYTARYCDGKMGDYGWDCSGSSNTKELQSNISRYFLRRKKEEVLPELPTKRYINIPVEMSEEKKFEYDLAKESLVDYLREFKHKEKEEIDKSMQAEQLVQLGILRLILTQSKIEAANEMIKNIIDSEEGEKVVVFSCYNEVLETLYDKFEKEAVIITGKTPEFARKELVKSFQEDPNIKIFFGGIKSAGVGITLTAGQNVLFIDYGWIPGDHEQAMDRIHRIGQKAKSICIYQLYVKDTIDEKMVERLSHKRKIINKLIEEEVEASPEEHILINDLIKDIN